MKRYKLEHTLEERKNQTDLLLVRYKDRAPIIVEYDNKIKKILFPFEATIGMLLYKLRSILSMKESQGLFVFIMTESENTIIPKVSDLIGVLYQENKHSDNLLYVIIKIESTFGMALGYNWRIQYQMFKIKDLDLRNMISSRYNGNKLCCVIFIPYLRKNFIRYFDRDDTLFCMKRSIIMNYFWYTDPPLLPSKININFIDPKMIKPVFSKLIYSESMFLAELKDLLLHRDDNMFYMVVTQCLARLKRIKKACFNF